MQKDEAIKILARHLMQCGMMMPIEWVQNNSEGSEFMQAYQMAMDALKNEPVLCKECKHLEITGCYGECRKLVRIVKPWDFCSYGERKTNGQ